MQTTYYSFTAALSAIAGRYIGEDPFFVTPPESVVVSPEGRYTVTNCDCILGYVDAQEDGDRGLWVFAITVP